MRTLGNIIWHIPFLGFLSAFFTFLFGGLLVVTVVGAPIGLGLIQLAKFLLSPFSSKMISKDDLNVQQNQAWKAYGLIIRILYIPFGVIMSMVVLFQTIAMFVSIVGIPVAVVLAKSLPTYFNPVNKICVSSHVAEELSRQKAQEYIARKRG